MTYLIKYVPSVEKDLKKLPREVAQEAIRLIQEEIAKDPFRGRPLKGRYKGLWKYRIRDWRIIYNIEKTTLIILVLRVRHRKDVYEGIV
ncbi:MAG: type II toxin-antitoxin system RelE/ParE family toxin [Deltaproteobacteria bacterium]|nr:type II toxin-antitoxin system RelE/ParE family toxin [Deltaproteobacteria bacterium]